MQEKGRKVDAAGESGFKVISTSEKKRTHCGMMEQ